MYFDFRWCNKINNEFWMTYKKVVSFFFGCWNKQNVWLPTVFGALVAQSCYSLMEHMYLDNWILHLKERNRKKEPVIVAWRKLPNREPSASRLAYRRQIFTSWEIEHGYDELNRLRVSEVEAKDPRVVASWFLSDSTHAYIT